MSTTTTKRPGRTHNQPTTEDLIDRAGTLRATMAGAESELAGIKTTLAERGVTEAEGKLFRAKWVEVHPERLDTAAMTKAAESDPVLANYMARFKVQTDGSHYRFNVRKGVMPAVAAA